MLGTAQNSTGFPKYRSRLNISQPCATTPALPANESEITISSGDLTCSTLKAGEFSSHPFIPGPKGFAPLRICSSVQPANPEIGRAHVCTPVTNAHLVCRLLLDN